MALDVLDILKIFGFDTAVPTRLVRHQEDRLEKLIGNQWLELYQSYQSRPRFHNVAQIVSFYGVPSNRAALYGVYRVIGSRPASEGPILKDCPWSKEWRNEGGFFYSLERDLRFDELRDRLIIGWGLGTRSWVQKLAFKPVLEIKEPGRRLPPFEDYLEFSLSYHQLQGLFANPEAHGDWRAHLSAVGGVYLILAEGSGDLYIGSAYGEEGIWGRWRDYALTGHGGNAKVRKLIERDSFYPEGFRFSLLQIVPKTMVRDELLGHEARFKTKLGTRATGLNTN